LTDQLPPVSPNLLRSTTTGRLKQGNHRHQTSPPLPPPDIDAFSQCLDAYAQLCENITSSTKTEVHNVLHWRQRRTEPWSQVTSIENFAKFGHVVREKSERRDKQTDRHADRTTSLTHSHGTENVTHRDFNGAGSYRRQRITSGDRRCAATASD